VLHAFALALAPLLQEEDPNVPDAPVRAVLVEVQRIWDAAPHSAFTDLARFDERFYCAFREGRGHVSTDGRLRVLASDDGEAWEPAGLLELAGFDLRDAHLSVTSDRRLCLVGGAAPRAEDGARAPTGSVVSFSNDGATWTPVQIVSEPGRWLWSVTWHGGHAYGVTYAAGEGAPWTSLVRSADGRAFEVLVPELLGASAPNETRLVFDERGVCHALARCEKGPAQLGVSPPPYDDWTWKALDGYLGGPNLTRTPGGRWLAGGRRKDGGVHTALLLVEPQSGALTEILGLPSGGDTSYPGFVWHAGELWMSYYSSHEGKASIYLARIRVEEG